MNSYIKECGISENTVKIEEQRLKELRTELASIIQNATEQQKRCYMLNEQNNSVPLAQLVAFKDKQLEAMKISLGLKNLMIFGGK